MSALFKRPSIQLEDIREFQKPRSFFHIREGKNVSLSPLTCSRCWPSAYLCLKGVSHFFCCSLFAERVRQKQKELFLKKYFGLSFCRKFLSYMQSRGVAEYFGICSRGIIGKCKIGGSGGNLVLPIQLAGRTLDVPVTLLGELLDRVCWLWGPPVGDLSAAEFSWINWFSSWVCVDICSLRSLYLESIYLDSFLD